MCLVLRLEEILPRPAAGLLHRMLRLAPVDCELRAGSADPTLLVHADALYQLSVVAYQVRAVQHLSEMRAILQSSISRLGLCASSTEPAPRCQLSSWAPVRKAALLNHSQSFYLPPSTFLPHPKL